MNPSRTPHPAPLIYISGQISGRNWNEVLIEFNNKQKELEDLGYRVINPCNNGLPKNAPYYDHMVRDIELLFKCDAVYMLPDWHLSDGARVEHFIANTYRKKIIYQ